MTKSNPGEVSMQEIGCMSETSCDAIDVSQYRKISYVVLLYWIRPSVCLFHATTCARLNLGGL